MFTAAVIQNVYRLPSSNHRTNSSTVSSAPLYNKLLFAVSSPKISSALDAKSNGGARHGVAWPPFKTVMTSLQNSTLNIKINHWSLIPHNSLCLSQQCFYFFWFIQRIIIVFNHQRSTCPVCFLSSRLHRGWSRVEVPGTICNFLSDGICSKTSKLWSRSGIIPALDLAFLSGSINCLRESLTNDGTTMSCGNTDASGLGVVFFTISLNKVVKCSARMSNSHHGNGTKLSCEGWGNSFESPNDVVASGNVIEG